MQSSPLPPSWKRIKIILCAIMEANAKKNLVDVLFSILRLLPAFLDYTNFIEINFIYFNDRK